MRVKHRKVKPSAAHLLFCSSPHQSPLPWIKGLKWGEYVGSPSAPDPVVCFSQTHGERFGSLLALPTRAICGLSRKFCLMMIYSKEQGKVLLRSVVCFTTGFFLFHSTLSPLLRCAEYAQHRHPVVSHPELGLRRQHTAAEEQTEWTAHQLHSVLTAPSGKTKVC